MSRDQDEILLGGVDSDLANRYRTAKQKVRERTGVSLSIAGGGRSRERQQKYFEQGKTPYDGSNPNAPHPLGLALDLNWKGLPSNIQSVAAEELRNVGLRQGGVLANGYSEKHHWQLPAVTDGNYLVTGLDDVGSSSLAQNPQSTPQTISDGNIEVDFSPDTQDSQSVSATPQSSGSIPIVGSLLNSTPRTLAGTTVKKLHPRQNAQNPYLAQATDLAAEAQNLLSQNQPAPFVGTRTAQAGRRPQASIADVRRADDAALSTIPEMNAMGGPDPADTRTMAEQRAPMQAMDDYDNQIRSLIEANVRASIVNGGTVSYDTIAAPVEQQLKIYKEAVAKHPELRGHDPQTVANEVNRLGDLQSDPETIRNIRKSGQDIGIPLLQGFKSSVGSTVRALGNLADVVNAGPQSTKSQSLTDTANYLKEQGRGIEEGQQVSDLIDEPQNGQERFQRSLLRGVGATPGMIAKFEAFGIPTMIAEGGLSRADEGIGGVLKGAAESAISLYGMQATGKVLSPLVNAFTWTAIPTAKGVLIDHKDLSDALGESIPGGVLAGISSEGIENNLRSKGFEPFNLKAEDGRTATVYVDGEGNFYSARTRAAKSDRPDINANDATFDSITKGARLGQWTKGRVNADNLFDVRNRTSGEAPTAEPEGLGATPTEQPRIGTSPRQIEGQAPSEPTTLPTVGPGYAMPADSSELTSTRQPVNDYRIEEQGGKVYVVDPQNIPDVKTYPANQRGRAAAIDRLRTLSEQAQPKLTASIGAQLASKGINPPAQIAPESVSPVDATANIPEQSEGEQLHYSNAQNRRVRNVATGNKGQFKKGFRDANEGSAERVEGVSESSVLPIPQGAGVFPATRDVQNAEASAPSVGQTRQAEQATERQLPTPELGAGVSPSEGAKPGDIIPPMPNDSPVVSGKEAEGQRGTSDRSLDFKHSEELSGKERRNDAPFAIFRIQDSRFPLPERSRDYWDTDTEHLEGVSGFGTLLNASRDMLSSKDVDGLGVNYAENVKDEGGEPILSVFAGTDLGDESPNVNGWSVEPQRETEIRFTPDEILTAWKRAVLKEFPHDAESVAKMDFSELDDSYQLEDFDVDAFHALRDIAASKASPSKPSNAPTIRAQPASVEQPTQVEVGAHGRFTHLLHKSYPHPETGKPLPAFLTEPSVRKSVGLPEVSSDEAKSSAETQRVRDAIAKRMRAPRSSYLGVNGFQRFIDIHKNSLSSDAIDAYHATVLEHENYSQKLDGFLTHPIVDRILSEAQDGQIQRGAKTQLAQIAKQFSVSKASADAALDRASQRRLEASDAGRGSAEPKESTPPIESQNSRTESGLRRPATKAESSTGESDSFPLARRSASQPSNQLNFVGGELIQQHYEAPRDATREQVEYAQRYAESEALKKAFGDDNFRALLGLQEEDRPQQIRAISKEIIRRAPVVQKKGESGQLAVSDLVTALKKLNALRLENTPVNDFLNQGSLFDAEPISSTQEGILKALDVAKNPATIGRVLDQYLGAVVKESASQGALFSGGTFVERANELASKPIEQVIKGIKFSSTAPHRIKVNEEAYLALHGAYNSIESDRGRNFPGFTGVFNDPDYITKLTNKLNQAAAYYRRAGRPLWELGQAIKQAAKSDGTVILYRDDSESAIPHEEAHRSSYLASQGKGLEARHGHFQRVYRSPEMQKARVHLLEYYPDIPGVLVEEAYAHIIEGNREAIGLSEDEAARFLRNWRISFEAKNGKITASNFGDTYEPLERITEGTPSEVRTGSRTESGQVSTGRDRSLQEVSQGAGEESSTDASEALAKVDTNTPAFKRWFGSSKVVDERGEPLVVYHGTNARFNIFDKGKFNTVESSGDYVGEGFFFTTSRYKAEQFAKQAVEKHGGEPHVISAYLSIKNPFVPKKGMFDAMADEELQGYFKRSPNSLRAELESQGHDGLIDSDYGQFAVFDSTQIKSVNNQGTFDPSDPNILRKSDKSSDAISNFQLIPEKMPPPRTLPPSPRQSEAGFINLPSLKNLKNTAVSLANLPRAVMTSFDLSAPLRQGAIFTLTEPKLAVKAFADMIRGISSKRYATFKQQLDLHPMIELAEESGLHLTSLAGDKLEQKEEVYMSNLAEKIPGVKQSEQAYVSYLDSIRMGAFEKYAKEMGSAGITSPESYKAIARFINAATGRGDLGKTLNNAAPILNSIFFSPRYLASRIQLMNPVEYMKMPAAARKIAMRKMFEFAALIGLTLFLLKQSGADVNLTNPDSPDWLKVKLGNTRYDFLAGFQQPARFAYRLAESFNRRRKGERLSESEQPSSIIGKFLRSKENPGFSLLHDYVSGKDFNGELFRLLPGKDKQGEMKAGAIGSRLIPIIVQDAYEGYKDAGGTGIARTLPATMLGVGVQTYSPNNRSTIRPSGAAPKPPSAPRPIRRTVN